MLCFTLLCFAFLSIKSHTIRIRLVCGRITVAYHSYTVHIKSHSIPIRFLCHRITVAYHTYTFRIKSHTFRIQLAITSHTLELNQFILISSFFYSTFLFSYFIFLFSYSTFLFSYSTPILLQSNFFK